MWFFIIPILFSVGLFSQEPAGRRHQEYERLASRLFRPVSLDSKGRLAVAQDWSQPSPEEALQYKKYLHDLIGETITETLRQPDKASLVSKVVSNLRSLQGTMHKNNEDLPAAIQRSIGDQEVLAVAFEILEGPVAIAQPEPYIQFYANRSNFWYLAAEAPPDLSKLAMTVQSVGSPVPGELWVLARGRRYGDNRGTVYARLYAFDGTSVRTVWERDALFGGKIDVTKDRITVTYYDSAKWGIDPPAREEYAITSTGLRQVR